MCTPLGTVIVSRRRRESNPRTGLCRPLPRPLGHSAAPGTQDPDQGYREPCWPSAPRYGVRRLRADDGIRTRDPHLGKVMLYQLSHVRMIPTGPGEPPPTRMTRVQNCSRSWRTSKLTPAVPRSRVLGRRCYRTFTAIVTHAAGSLDIAGNTYSIRCILG